MNLRTENTINGSGLNDENQHSTDALTMWLTNINGPEADTHEVYFGTDEQAVMSGVVPATTVSETSYDAGTLELGQTYYWRIDEVKNHETPATTKYQTH